MQWWWALTGEEADVVDREIQPELVRERWAGREMREVRSDPPQELAEQRLSAQDRDWDISRHGPPAGSALCNQEDSRQGKVRRSARGRLRTRRMRGQARWGSC